MPFRKKRDIFEPLGSGMKRNDAFATWQPYTLMPQRHTIEDSIGSMHSFRDGHWSGGGDWFLTRDRTLYPMKGSMNSSTVQGPTIILGPTSSLPSLSKIPEKTDAEMFRDGGTAIARTEPTNPAFNLSQFIGELRQEGLPKAPDIHMKTKVDLARKSGKNYLNVEFGWMPLVRDVRSFATAVHNSDSILKKYHQESGQGLHRSYAFPSTYNQQVDLRSFSIGPSVSTLGFAQGTAMQRVSQRTWFSARYVYCIPANSDMHSKLERMGSDARKLLGVDLTPETLWNLTPWSWALDYFGTTGDLMHNISALGKDGMVMSYGYIMCHTSKETIFEGKSSSGWLTSIRTEETKSRRTATPYGFGVDTDGLSSTQYAVLAALGLSRV